MYIEGIALENFSAFTKAYINSTTPSRQRHAVFHSLLSDDNKYDASTTTSNKKHFISLTKKKKVVKKSFSKIW